MRLLRQPFQCLKVYIIIANSFPGVEHVKEGICRGFINRFPDPFVIIHSRMSDIMFLESECFVLLPPA
jgi:hypothetical protein